MLCYMYIHIQDPRSEKSEKSTLYFYIYGLRGNSACRGCIRLVKSVWTLQVLAHNLHSDAKILKNTSKRTPRPTAAPKSGATANPAAISFAASVSILFLQSFVF